MKNHVVAFVFLLNLPFPALCDTTSRKFKEPDVVSQGGINTAALLKGRCVSSSSGSKFSDQLASSDARKRIDWAIACGHITTTAKKLFTHTLDTSTYEWMERSDKNLGYPTFAYNKKDEGYPVWIPNYSSCDMPSNVVWFSVCEAGCYADSQRVLFESGYKTLPEALLSEAPNYVMTLDPTFSSENLIFTPEPVYYYTRDVRDAEHILLEFRTEQNHVLIVTKNHPLLDSTGYIKYAEHFKVGDRLISEFGDKVKIESITDVPYYGKVYNVAPKSNDATKNIVIAEGLLNGSVRYQDSSIKNLDRVLMRSLLPSDF